MFIQMHSEPYCEKLHIAYFHMLLVCNDHLQFLDLNEAVSNGQSAWSVIGVTYIDKNSCKRSYYKYHTNMTDFNVQLLVNIYLFCFEKIVLI